jgi:hypothetical protein
MASTPDLTSSLPKAETLALSKKLTMVFEAIDGDKIRVTSSTWGDEAKVILKGEVFEVRTVWGGLRFARKERFHDEKDAPVAPYDPYGPGPGEEVVEAPDQSAPLPGSV